MSDLVSAGERVVSPSVHSFPQPQDFDDNVEYSSFNQINHEKKDSSNIPEAHDIRDEMNPNVMPLTRMGSLFASYVTDAASSTSSLPDSYFTEDSKSMDISSSFTGSLKQIVTPSMATISSTTTDDFVNRDLPCYPAVVSRNPSLKLSADNPQPPITYSNFQSYRCAKDDDDDDEMSSRRSSSIKIDSEDDEDIDGYGELPTIRNNMKIASASTTSRWDEKKQSSGPLPTPQRSSMLPQNPARQRRGAIGYSSLMMASAVLAKLELGDETDDDSRPQMRPTISHQSDLLFYPSPSLPQRTRSSPMIKRRFDNDDVATDLNLSDTHNNSKVSSLPSPQNLKKGPSDPPTRERRPSNINKSISFICSGRETSPFSLSAAERINAKQTRTSTTWSATLDDGANDDHSTIGSNISDPSKTDFSSKASPVSISNEVFENEDNDTVLCPPKRRRADF